MKIQADTGYWFLDTRKKQDAGIWLLDTDFKNVFIQYQVSSIKILSIQYLDSIIFDLNKETEKH